VSYTVLCAYAVRATRWAGGIYGAFFCNFSIADSHPNPRKNAVNH
jgi:hypothetical protein